MSYIRSTSNPEALYIWGDLDRKVTVMKGPTIIGRMPTRLFDALIKSYHENYHDVPCIRKRDGEIAEVKEIWIKGTPKIKVSYKNIKTKDTWKVTMWEVTWNHIVFTNIKS